MNAREFAKERLALFSHYGFEGQGRRIADGKGRSTYLIAREIIARETKADRRPLTILFHGGLSQASEWAPEINAAIIDGVAEAVPGPVGDHHPTGPGTASATPSIIAALISGAPPSTG